MNTEDLPFPFWMLIHRGSSPWRPVTFTPGIATAFSTLDAVRAFGELDPGWEFRFICRATLMRLSDEFARQGVRGVCLDPVSNKSRPSAPAAQAPHCEAEDLVAALAEGPPRNEESRPMAALVSAGKRMNYFLRFEVMVMKVTHLPSSA